MKRETIISVLQRMKEIGIDLSWYGPRPEGLYGSRNLDIAEIIEAMLSSSKYPLETQSLGVTEEEYESWQRWFRGPEGKFEQQRCLAQTSKRKQCTGSAYEYEVPIKNFENYAFCHRHRHLVKEGDASPLRTNQSENGNFLN